MKIIEEFKKFAIKGNVIDLAVAVVIGGSFGKIVSSLVDDIIMPLVGVVMGGVKFSNLSLALNGDVRLAYGSFIQSIVDFLIIAWAIFFVIKGINRMKKDKPKEAEKPTEPSEEIKLLTDIRDSLRR
jgi:large conductance mechanosensitive channel